MWLAAVCFTVLVIFYILSLIISLNLCGYKLDDWWVTEEGIKEEQFFCCEEEVIDFIVTSNVFVFLNTFNIPFLMGDCLCF